MQMLNKIQSRSCELICNLQLYTALVSALAQVEQAAYDLMWCIACQAVLLLLLSCICCRTSLPSSSSASSGTFVSMEASAQHPLSCSLLKLRSSCFKGQLSPAGKRS
jgi:hypothetical protein